MKPVENLSDDEFSHLVRRAVRELPDVPEALQQAAIQLWRVATPAAAAGAAAQAVVQAVWRQVVAVLSFDSWASPALAAGMRSGRSPTRHLLFSAQGRDIDLRIAPTAQAFSLAGQILGPDASGVIELITEGGAGHAARVTDLDALGEFRIDGLSRGIYRMTLRVGGDEIVMPPLDVGEPSH